MLVCFKLRFVPLPEVPTVLTYFISGKYTLEGTAEDCCLTVLAFGPEHFDLIYRNIKYFHGYFDCKQNWDSGIAWFEENTTPGQKVHYFHNEPANVLRPNGASGRRREQDAFEEDETDDDVECFGCGG